MFQNVLTKMMVENNKQVDYFLNFKNDFIHVNQLIGKKIKLKFKGYECLSCQSNLEIYRQGYCKKCFFEIPSTAQWVMKPELSKAHLNIEERNLEYEKSVQLKPHIVYLAFSSEIKVGVTRKTQIPYRWIDQGAVKAVQIAELPNRYLAGISEVELKKYYSDKTNWREMLKIDSTKIDLEKERINALNLLPEKTFNLCNDQSFKEFNISYPVRRHPIKPKSLNIIKENSFFGELVGIKGQYLIFGDDTVFNVRSNEGIVVSIDLN